ncbi:MAG TPA: GWxTD domain-containing protein, partial [Bacteroidota bacterium]|nr:GWxTD domain-containing protein [Bacteroidota bacterium]
MTRLCMAALTLSVCMASCAGYDAGRVATQDFAGEAKAALAGRDWAGALALADRGLSADGGDIACHYVAAVAGREVGAGLLSRNSAWRSARRHFEWILSRDSSYADVLYQFALLERYQGNRDRALDLVRAQISKKPSLPGPQIGIYRLYKYFMGVEDPEEFSDWLGSQPGVLPRYFAGEALRRSGKIAAADSVLSAVLHEPGEVSIPAIRLSLARVRFAQGEERAAEAEYWKGVSGINDALGSALMFEDLKYVVSDRELDEFNGLDSVAQCRDFFRSFWNSRNPSMALSVNLRLQEHLRRFLYAEAHYEYYGFRSRFNNPDEMHELRFPKTFALNDEFNDMGLIFLRQGEPDDVLRANLSPFDNEDDVFDRNSPAVHPRPLDSDITFGARIMVEEGKERLWEGLRLSSSQQDPCESWLYDATPESPKMIFNFQKHNTGANNWRISPVPSNPRLIEDLAMWDVNYLRLGAERSINRVVAQDKVKEASTTLARYALTTDKQTWETKTEVFHFPHAIDVFRAPDGNSLLDVSYAIPLAVLSRGLPDSVTTVPVEIGFSLVDAKSHHKAVQRDTMAVGLARTRTGTIIDLIRYTVPPDSYFVSMHMRPLRGGMIGTWQQAIAVRNFSGPEFMMSSLQFLRSSTEKGALAIDGVKVVQSPFNAHERTEPFYVYFQIYNLVADATGETSYRAECVLLPHGEEDASKGIVVNTCEKKGKEG